MGRNEIGKTSAYRQKKPCAHTQTARIPVRPRTTLEQSDHNLVGKSGRQEANNENACEGVSGLTHSLRGRSTIHRAMSRYLAARVLLPLPVQYRLMTDSRYPAAECSPTVNEKCTRDASACHANPMEAERNRLPRELRSHKQ